MLKQYLKFVIPSICSMVIFNLYTLVDGIFVAHYEGDTALASINHMSQPFSPLESYLRLDRVR